VAFWFGLCALVSVAGNLRHPAFDANTWWIDLRSDPRGVRDAFMTILAIALVAFAVRPVMRRWRRVVTLPVIAIAVFVATGNVVTYYRSWGSDRIEARTFVPLSVPIAGLLVAVAVVILRPSPP